VEREKEKVCLCVTCTPLEWLSESENERERESESVWVCVHAHTPSARGLKASDRRESISLSHFLSLSHPLIIQRNVVFRWGG